MYEAWTLEVGDLGLYNDNENGNCSSGQMGSYK